MSNNNDFFLDDDFENDIYRFCKVSFDFPNRPNWYYFPGELSLSVGDIVLAPFGANNTIREGVVTSVGECFASAFPCPVEDIKYVLETLEEDVWTF